MPKTFVFNKLVRDKIPDLMKSEGCKVDPTMLVGEELLQALATKAVEELDELEKVINKTQEEIIAELADLKEVVEARMAAQGDSDTSYDIDEILHNMNHQMSVNEIIKAKSIDRRILQEMQTKKRKKEWGFEKWYYIDEVIVPKTSPWFRYLSDNYEEKI